MGYAVDGYEDESLRDMIVITYTNTAVEDVEYWQDTIEATRIFWPLGYWGE